MHIVVITEKANLLIDWTEEWPEDRPRTEEEIWFRAVELNGGVYFPADAEILWEE